MSKITILLAENSEEIYNLLRQTVLGVSNDELLLEWVNNYQEAIKKARKNEHDMYLFDYDLAREGGLHKIRELILDGLSSPVALLCRKEDPAIVRDMSKVGAVDYINLKDINPVTINKLIRYSSELKRIHDEISAVNQQLLANEQQLLVSESELQESEKRYQKMIESAKDIIFSLSARGGILTLNPAFKNITGWEIGEWTGRFFEDLLHPDDLEVARKYYELSDESESNLLNEVRFRTKDGEYRALEVMASIRYENRKPIVVQGVARDVTERKRMQAEKDRIEEQFHHSQKMDALGQLVSGIAHDFNNILVAVNGYAELAIGSLTQEDPLWNYVSEIKVAGDKASDLNRQLLAFSRKQTAHPQVLDLNKVILNISKMLTRIIGEDINLTCNLAAIPCWIKADPSQLEQVIINLVVNARDAIHMGDNKNDRAIIIETQKIDVDEQLARKYVESPTGSYISLAVIDKGIGIKEEIKDRIFDPFFTTKDPGKGTGLGLSTVYGIVKQNSGSICVESKLGIGTKFEILWPFNEESKKEINIPQAAPPVLKGTETILLVEDYDSVREFAREVLEHAGYKIMTARNGAEALEIAGRGSQLFDLVITDLVMPKMGGKELFKEFRKIQHDVKFIFTSGYQGASLLGELMLSEKNFIDKPFSGKVLSQRVREILDEKK